LLTTLDGSDGAVLDGNRNDNGVGEITQDSFDDFGVAHKHLVSSYVDESILGHEEKLLSPAEDVNHECSLDDLIEYGNKLFFVDLVGLYQFFLNFFE